MKATLSTPVLRSAFCPFLLSILLLLACMNAMADEWVYDDVLHYDALTDSGWQNWSTSGVDFGNTSVVRSGSESIVVNLSTQYFMLGHYPYPFDISAYSEIKFAINGGEVGGTDLYLIFAYTDSSLVYFKLPTIQPNTWQDITFSLTDPGNPANRVNFEDMIIDDFSNLPSQLIYLDDIRFVQVPESGTTAILALAALSMAIIRRRR
jgi:hypothetical protein